ncbi:hypothetical protein [Psychromonas ossibalaenae]|uniref:hypothetical protein n=1 Tax=Psychromonas ossibalaenae TaxID=444922 RepID=UPI0003691E61|nr:hypothetical protein [Psychromonas ossibalaenae]
MNNPKVREHEELAKEFYSKITNKDAKNDIFEWITDEQFELIKKSFSAETRKRNQKRYYRFECPLQNQIIWCIESKLGTHLKCQQFKRYLKTLGKGNKSANRNKESSIYIYPHPAEKPYLNSDELESHFTQDPNGMLAQPHAIEKRPHKLAKLQA